MDDEEITERSWADQMSVLQENGEEMGGRSGDWKAKPDA